MEKFEKLTAVAAPMPASNIDTDIIMPKGDEHHACPSGGAQIHRYHRDGTRGG